MIINKRGNKYLITISIEEAQGIHERLEKAKEAGESSIVLKASIEEKDKK